MKRLSFLGSVVGLQALGSIATLASVALIARTRGPEVQGTFGIVKAEVDLLVAGLLLGMPQAFFFFLSRGGIGWSRVRRITMLQSIGAAVLGVVLLSWRHPDSWGDPWVLLAVAIAVAGFVAHGNLRGGVLYASSPFAFSLVTALPGLFLLVSVGITLAIGALDTLSYVDAAWVLAASSVAACVVTSTLVLRLQSTPVRVDDAGVSVQRLLRYGAATWIPAIGQTLSPVLALGWINSRIGDPVGVGVFAAAILALNLVLTPFAMTVPLLFKRWVDAAGPSRWSEMRRATLWVLPVCAVFAVVVLLVEKPLVGALLGPEYISRGPVFALMALSIGPQTVSRLLGVALSADGRPWFAVTGELARVAGFALGLVAFEPQTLLAISVLWVSAEVLNPALGWLVLSRYSVARGRP